MSRTVVTDLDFFVGLGHSEKAVRDALLLARGDRNTALFYLARAGASGDRGQLAWRKVSPEDWVDGATKAVSTIAENRALHQSPVYIFVQDYYPGDDGEYVYRMQITQKDGSQWKTGRTFPEFSSLYNSLPFGSVRSLTKSFPAQSMIQNLFVDTQSKAFLDKRLEGLSEWMRDLVLNEQCMSNTKLLDLLYAFVEVGKHKPGTAPIEPTPQNLASPLLLETQDSTQVAFLKRKSSYFSQAVQLGPEQLPISVEDAVQRMPIKVNIKTLQCYHDLIAIKQSAESKQSEDKVRNEEQSEEDAELMAALAASEAEARELAEENAQLEAAIQASMQTASDVIKLDSERLDETASPLHFTEESFLDGVNEEEEFVTKPSAESVAAGNKKSEDVLVHPTFCFPPHTQTAADTDADTDADAEAAEKPDQPLPARVLSRMQSTSMLGLMIDTVQLQKDCSRDRIVVQGKRLDGARTDLDHVYTLSRDSILQAMVRAGKQVTLVTSNSPRSPVKAISTTNPFDDFETDSVPELSGTIARPPVGPVGPVSMLLTDEELAAELHRAELRESHSPLTKNPFEESENSPGTAHSPRPNSPIASTSLREDCELLSRVALSLLSRSESGYLSHASLHEIFDVENFHQAPNFSPFFFVPEATLSDPLQLTFSIFEKGSSEGSITQAARGKFAQPALAEEWCVECTGETSTVYRLMDAMSLEPLLQIRVIFQVTLFGMPQYSAGHSREVTGLTMKDGKCHVLVDKITTTSSRDWASPKKL